MKERRNWGGLVEGEWTRGLPEPAMTKTCQKQVLSLDVNEERASASLTWREISPQSLSNKAEIRNTLSEGRPPSSSSVECIKIPVIGG